MREKICISFHFAYNLYRNFDVGNEKAGLATLILSPRDLDIISSLKYFYITMISYISTIFLTNTPRISHFDKCMKKTETSLVKVARGTSSLLRMAAHVFESKADTCG